MPRNYERKTVKSYTDKTLAKCINAFENGKMSLGKASKYFQVCFVIFFLYFADCFSYIPEWEGSISPASFHLSFFSKFTDVLFLLTLFALVN